jgi:cell division protein FtsQ
MITRQKISRTSFTRQRSTPLKRSINTLQRVTQTVRKAAPSASAARASSSRVKTNPHRIGYDIAFTLGRTNVRAPVLNIPQLGPRWVSAGLTLLLGFLLLTMWTGSPFRVATAEVRGNQRLGATEINAMLGMLGQPIFKAVPAQITADLHTAFSDLQSIRVHVDFPNRIIVDVVERTPVMAWYQNGVLTWIDTNGVAFMPRGDVPGLVLVAANGAPTRVPLDPALPLYEQKFIAPEMVQALTVLARDVPAGMPMIFDPLYGMGWQDPRGWTVYFGQDSRDIPMKKIVYQAIVDTLTLQGVQPELISVEYLNAPFYK